MELEICLEVHLALLLEHVGCNQAIHVLPLLAFLVFAFADNFSRTLIAEVLKLELLFLDEDSFVRLHRQVMLILVELFADVVLNKTRVP